MNPAEIAARYVSALSQRAVTAPADLGTVEAALVWGLGVASALFLIVSLVRRSAGAAVSFSLLTLTGLIVGIATGRLGFLPPGTAVLVLSLYACAVLLFLTSCVRVARDNPALGVVILVSILSLVALGGASALDMTDGAAWVGWALAGVAVFALGTVLFDLVRGDRAAVVLLPGIALAALSPVPMLAAGPGASWQHLASPLVLLAIGTLLATVAALFVATPPEAPRARKVRRAHAPSWADDHAFFGEVGDGPRAAFAEPERPQAAPPPPP